MKLLRLLTIALGLGALLAPAAGRADSKDFVIYVTRLGGDSESARPYIAKASAYFEKAMGWPAGSANGVFLPDKKEALAFITEKKPGFAILEPPLYFELQQSYKLTPLVQLKSKQLVSKSLHLVVKDPQLTTLEQLKGKKLWTTLGGCPTYLSRVVLAGKVDADTHFKLKKIGYALKGVRAVLRGRAEATLLDDEMLGKAKQMTGGDQLKTLYSSPALPPPPLAVFSEVMSAKEQKRLSQVLLKMCSSPQGAPICQEIMIGAFEPIDRKLFQQAQKRYNAK